MTPGNEFYSEEEVQAILRLASQPNTQRQTSRDQLYQMANELGLSPDAVAHAESQLAGVRKQEEMKAREAEEREEYRRQVRSGIRGHLASYIGVNLGLIGIWAATTSPPTHDFWPIFPMLGWGIGVVAHLGSVVGKSAFEEGFQKWRRDRNLVAEGRQALGPVSQTMPAAPIDSFMSRMVESGVRDRIEAIKVYRDVTGCDLMTAKQVVEDYVARNPSTFR